jgi:hypothetical protein
MPHQLFTTLRVALTEPSELEHVLGEHFHGSRSEVPTEVEYPGVAGQHAIRVFYNRATIVDIQPGPALTEQDVNTLASRIEAELIADVGHLFGQRVLFASVPTTGCFQYKTVFQISPVPDEAPRPGFLVADHPLSLWCQFKNTPNAALRIGRLQAKVREIELLLSAITVAGFRSEGTAGRSHWVLLPGDIQTAQVGFQQEFYSYPGMNAQRESMPDISNCPGLAMVPAAEYASRRGIEAGQVLNLPDSVVLLCDSFVALDPDRRDAFLTAGFWLQHARRVFSHSRSAYFTALISGVESLMPDAASQENCPGCGRSVGKGPTKRFIEFAEQFGPQDYDARAERRKLYSIRSALSHGGTLLRSDFASWHGGLSEAKIAEWDNLDAASQLVRAVLVGWLAAQHTTG